MAGMLVVLLSIFLVFKLRSRGPKIFSCGISNNKVLTNIGRVHVVELFSDVCR